MKRFLVAMGVAAFAFVGCGDDSSSSSGPDDDQLIESSSSSNTQSDAKQSSSSKKTGKSSSSSKNIGSSCSSESDGVSSSSVKSESSSSVEDLQSSSSDKTSVSSSRESENSSSSLDFDWSLPKETYLNPEIEYDTIIDSRDGKVYRTVEIGGQTWMAENLNFDPGQGGSGDAKYDWSWCYNNEPKNCEVAGRFYTWAAAIDSVKLATDAKNPQDCGLRKECRIAAMQTPFQNSDRQNVQRALLCLAVCPDAGLYRRGHERF